jgi:hypothetical protein
MTRQSPKADGQPHADLGIPELDTAVNEILRIQGIALDRPLAIQGNGQQADQLFHRLGPIQREDQSDIGPLAHASH